MHKKTQKKKSRTFKHYLHSFKFWRYKSKLYEKMYDVEREPWQYYSTYSLVVRENDYGISKKVHKLLEACNVRLDYAEVLHDFVYMYMAKPNDQMHYTSGEFIHSNTQYEFNIMGDKSFMIREYNRADPQVYISYKKGSVKVELKYAYSARPKNNDELQEALTKHVQSELTEAELFQYTIMYEQFERLIFMLNLLKPLCIFKDTKVNAYSLYTLFSTHETYKGQLQ